ncbi:hypothetical protein C1645_761048 [Glomus cerebriforme]|uniref:Uncharacterized protein n=1 Tax=Glomus cerebriforme TaxID=658196 RepID=A0A397TAU6_9GLOM|nr:hypothetical protein C1645_761048 [Glomus cerebriforme]
MKSFLILTLLLVIVIKVIEALTLPENNNHHSLYDNNDHNSWNRTQSIQKRGSQQFEIITPHENRNKQINKRDNSKRGNRYDVITRRENRFGTIEKRYNSKRGNLLDITTKFDNSSEFLENIKSHFRNISKKDDKITKFDTSPENMGNRFRVIEERDNFKRDNDFKNVLKDVAGILGL